MRIQWHAAPIASDGLELLARSAGRPLSWQEMIERWHGGDTALGAYLASLPWPACYWECPPLTESDRKTPFRCVVLAAPALADRRAEPDAFREHFQRGRAVAAFSNLGGDARLIAPQPAPGLQGSHLLAFCRSASEEQAQALWRAVARQLDQALDGSPVWLSTSGLGVAWLHVRLDRTPKYYQHAPYRTL